MNNNSKGGENMPRGDGTGPMGRGRLTGRGFGPCGRGFGRGMGFGYGMGFRRPTKEEEKELMESVIPIFSPDFLRKYIAYAKRNIFPVMNDDALEILKNYYVDFRSSAEESVPFTPRQLEAFVRLAEASARVKLSDEATVDDAKRAISIIDQYLRRVGMDRETGKFDIDIIATGISHTQHERMRLIIDIIQRISNESKDGNAPRSDIIREAEIQGLESSRVEEALDRLKRNGQIYEPMHGKYRVTEY